MIRWGWPLDLLPGQARTRSAGQAESAPPSADLRGCRVGRTLQDLRTTPGQCQSDPETGARLEARCECKRDPSAAASCGGSGQPAGHRVSGPFRDHPPRTGAMGRAHNVGPAEPADLSGEFRRRPRRRKGIVQSVTPSHDPLRCRRTSTGTRPRGTTRSPVTSRHRKSTALRHHHLPWLRERRSRRGFQLLMEVSAAVCEHQLLSYAGP
jgi:hypothetical protein